jgi:hypothetical protein
VNCNTLSALIPSADDMSRSQIVHTLNLFNEAVLSFVADSGATICPLQHCQRYDDASPALKRLGIDVDTWPAPPAGLFVVEERCVYLRSKSTMTVAHEFAHALDCALGHGAYWSSSNHEIRDAFCDAKAFVTPYAATAIDEYFAECVRAYVEANDPASIWPRATRERLHRVDPTMSSLIAKIFTQLSP